MSAEPSPDPTRPLDAAGVAERLAQAGRVACSAPRGASVAEVALAREVWAWLALIPLELRMREIATAAALALPWSAIAEKAACSPAEAKRRHSSAMATIAARLADRSAAP